MTSTARLSIKWRVQLGGRLGWSIVATIGYILSPLSWWNDGFVNIPMSLLAAKLISSILPVGFIAAFYASYAATNIAGIILLHLGVGGAMGRVRLDRRIILKQALIAAAYSAAMYPLLSLLGLT